MIIWVFVVAPPRITCCRVIAMQKTFWLCTGLISLALLGSHLRSAAFDFQLTRLTWCQAATNDGRLRIVVVRGDPTASWTAQTVIARDKATWRLGLSTTPLAIKVYHATADLLGTPVDTYRLDLPLLLPLLLLSGVVLLIKGWKRWGAPPGMIWAECWRRNRQGNLLIRAGRGMALAVLMLLSLGTAVLWIGGRIGLPASWSHFGYHFAFATTNPHAGFGFQVPPGAASVAARIDESVKEEAAQMGETSHYFAIDVMDGMLGVRYFRKGDTQGTPTIRYQHAAGGFEVREELLPAPSYKMRFPPWFYSKVGLPLGVERTLVMPSWVWLMLFGLWPFWAFVRGPLRRARRRATGCCRKCGYNLTGLTQPRCPECGEWFDSTVSFLRHRKSLPPSQNSCKALSDLSNVDTAPS